MVKRRDIIRFLELNGFVSVGGTNHEKYQKGDRFTFVPRHREIKEQTFKKILKDAGLEKDPDKKGFPKK